MTLGGYIVTNLKVLSNPKKMSHRFSPKYEI